MSSRTVADDNAYPNPQGYPSGLTKREYFAAMAMQELLHIEKPGGYRDDVSIKKWMARAASGACIAADALIAALNEGQQ